MKKDIAELPSDVQEQIRALEALPEDQIDTTDALRFLTGPTPDVESSTGR